MQRVHRRLAIGAALLLIGLAGAPQRAAAAATTTLTTGVIYSSVTLGQPVRDTATLSGGTNPGGSITFKLYGPNDATCTGPAIDTSPAISVSGNGTYYSDYYTPTAVGTYRYTASYSGDTGNSASSSPCNAANESVDVLFYTTSLSTSVISTSVQLGQPIRDSATLSGGGSPVGGSITFKLYGPNDATCTGPAIDTSPAISVSGNGTYYSDYYTPTAVGTYRYTASYSGDTGNSASSSGCNAANESTTVVFSTTSLSTSVLSATAQVNQQIEDSATLSGAGSPVGGSITFKVYGPNDATCSGTVIYTSPAISVSGNGTYYSGYFTPTAAGVYRYTASYSGDTGNSASSSPCNAANESVSVSNPTWAPVHVFTVHHLPGRLSFRWTMADQHGVVGFNLYAGSVRLNPKLIRVRSGLKYTYVTRRVVGPYLLSIVMSTGSPIGVVTSGRRKP